MKQTKQYTKQSETHKTPNKQIYIENTTNKTCNTAKHNRKQTKCNNKL